MKPSKVYSATDGRAGNPRAHRTETNTCSHSRTRNELTSNEGVGAITESVEQLSQEELLTRLVAELSPDLKECTPKRGIERFLKMKQQDVTQNTLDGYEDKLSRLLSFCDGRGIEDLRNLDGRILDDYIYWLRNESSDEVKELAPKTMRDELYLLRDCISYLEEIEAVEPGLSDTISIPDLNSNEGVRDVELDAERVSEILEYLRKYRYASIDHVIFLLLARTGRRTGCIHSLDLKDVHLTDDEPYLELQNRPDEGTRLKNDQKSEGHVALSQDVATVIADFISNNRVEIKDDYGRQALLVTNFGRMAKSTIRRIVYSVTQPCKIGQPCPHDRDPKKCDAAQRRNAASECPSSHSPHSLKHGYISECRRQGIPLDVLSDRCDVTEECLRAYYDESTQKERREIRREVLDEYTSDAERGYL